MKRKGQAAMEFLMTYGWAILAAIIVIGVLAIYFRPSTLVTESAIVAAPFYAVASTVEFNAIQLEIQNNGGETLDVISVAVTDCTTLGDDTTHIDTSVPASEKISDGVTTPNVLDFACTIATGATHSGDITITYKRPNSALELTSTGTISGKA